MLPFVCHGKKYRLLTAVIFVIENWNVLYLQVQITNTSTTNMSPNEVR